MKRIVLDQGLPATAVVALRAAGWDAVHVREFEMHEAADIDILTMRPMSRGWSLRLIVTSLRSSL